MGCLTERTNKIILTESLVLILGELLQQLESSIKKELAERVRLVRILKAGEERKAPALTTEVRRSVALASGARVLEFKIITPAWAGQVCRLNPSFLSGFNWNSPLSLTLVCYNSSDAIGW